MIFNFYVFNNNRQMRGEELQGLNIEELQKLEKSLESGLSRVMEKKVSYVTIFYIIGIIN